MKDRLGFLLSLILGAASSAAGQVNVKVGDPVSRLDTLPPEKRREIEAAMGRDFQHIVEKRWPGPIRSARDIHLTIEPRRTTFQAGFPVEVRLTLTNQSGHKIRYVPLPFFYQVKLRAYDASGHEAKRSEWQAATMISGPTPPEILGPGESMTLRDGSRDYEWLDLKYWQYDSLEPGTYTIVGIPMVAGPTLTADTSVRSNRAQISITK